jgi:hypothetical protein
MKKLMFLFLMATSVVCFAEDPSSPKLPDSMEMLWPKAPVNWKSCDFSPAHLANAEAILFEKKGKTEKASLKNGNFERQIDPDNQLHQVRLKWSYVLEDKSFVLVSYIWEWVGGSSSQDVVVQVYACENGRPYIKQQITADGHSAYAGAEFDTRTQRLILRSTNYGKGAHCCPEFLDRALFHWTSQNLQLTAAETIPAPK